MIPLNADWPDISHAETDDIVTWMRSTGCHVELCRQETTWKCHAIISVRKGTFYPFEDVMFNADVRDKDCRTAVLRCASVVWQAQRANIRGFAKKDREDCT